MTLVSHPNSNQITSFYSNMVAIHSVYLSLAVLLFGSAIAYPAGSRSCTDPQVFEKMSPNEHAMCLRGHYERIAYPSGKEMNEGEVSKEFGQAKCHISELIKTHPPAFIESAIDMVDKAHQNCSCSVCTRQIVNLPPKALTKNT